MPTLFYRLSRELYFWVLIAIIIGGCLGFLMPQVGISLKPLQDAFIALIRMAIAPVIFLTVTLGIIDSGHARSAGKTGGLALLYFEGMSTFALFIGLVMVNWLKPGHGFNITRQQLDPSLVATYASHAEAMSTGSFLLHIIPKTLVDAFTAEGDLLQVLLVAILFGVALLPLKAQVQPLISTLASLRAVMFNVINLIMKTAPIGAGAAMAFTLGKYGEQALGPLLRLVGTMYLSCSLFIIVVLGIALRLAGMNLWAVLKHFRSECLTVLGTSSSESVLAPAMEKLENLGVKREIVGLVMPAGYSFNLDGTNIYLTLASLFIAQAMNIDLSLYQQLTLLLVAMLTSKGASGVSGAGFVTLAATLAIVPSLPIVGLALILGVDRFLSEARAVTNFIGNVVATLIIAKWQGQVDQRQLSAGLA